MLMRTKALIIIGLIWPAVAAAYYGFAPLEPLASFDSAREEQIHSIRADGHLSYGYAGGAFDADGGYVSGGDATTVFVGRAKIGWVFDRHWEADLVLHGVNWHDHDTGAFENGLGDVWLSGKGIWYTKEGGEFRMGPRLGIRFPGDTSNAFSDAGNAVDVAAVGFYDRRGGTFQLDAQVGFRQDMDSDRFFEEPGISAYLLADPCWALDDDERWVGGLSVGTYAGLGTVKTRLFWFGPRMQYIVDDNVRLEAGLLYPVFGKSYHINGYSHPVPRYATFYFGTQSVIPTRW